MRKFEYVLRCVSCKSTFTYLLEGPPDPTAYSGSSVYCPVCYDKGREPRVDEGVRLRSAIERVARRLVKAEHARHHTTRIRFVMPNLVGGYAIGVVSILHAGGEEPLMLVSAVDRGAERQPQTNVIDVHWEMLLALRSAFDGAVDELTVLRIKELEKPTQDELEAMAEGVADEETTGEGGAA